MTQSKRFRLVQLAALMGLLALALLACTSATPVAPTTAASAPQPSPVSPTAPGPTPTPIPTMTCFASRAGVSPAREAQEYLTSYDHILGDPKNGTVFLVVYSDFQCQACAQLAPILRALQKAHSQDVVLVFRHYPLINIHDKAALAAQAAEAAGKQGKFWEMHDLLFAEQQRWIQMSPSAFRNYLQGAAKRLGLDVTQFSHDLNSQEIQSLIQRAWQNGVDHSLPGVPLLYINTLLYTGPLDFQNLDTVVRLKILEAHQFHACPPITVTAEDDVQAVLYTTRGTLTLRLFPKQAPNAVNSFVFLAQQGWYNGNAFFEVSDAWVRTGDPSDTGYGNAGYTFALETSPDLTFDQAGRVALYNAGDNTNSSQFFITRKPIPAYDGHATIFGQVIQGLDVLNALDTTDQLLKVKILINGQEAP